MRRIRPTILLVVLVVTLLLIVGMASGAGLRGEHQLAVESSGGLVMIIASDILELSLPWNLTVSLALDAGREVTAGKKVWAIGEVAVTKAFARFDITVGVSRRWENRVPDHDKLFIMLCYPW
ncbi:MAG: hypothetical protein AB7E55_01365 [Pigmentiphaga sp.]